VFLGTVVRPVATLRALDADPHAGRHGALVLVGVSAAYTVILSVFLVTGYPAAARSVLGMLPERQYLAQVWYQAPLFFLTTAATAGALVLFMRLFGQRTAYRTAFGRIALATAIPFALTTMLIEAIVAALLALGVLDPLETLRWLLGSGAWFAALYQLVGLVWLVALVLVSVRVSGAPGWSSTVLVTVSLIALYALPIGLLIR
jgi:hypothetical protein